MLDSKVIFKSIILPKTFSNMKYITRHTHSSLFCKPCIYWINLGNITHSHSERPKEAWQIWKYFTYKSILLKIFEGGMLIRSQTTTLLQIFYEILLCSQVIFKSMEKADDTFQRNSECQWDKEGHAQYVIYLESSLTYWLSSVVYM